MAKIKNLLLMGESNTLNILFTGGSGRLGTELQKQGAVGDFPSSKEFNILNPEFKKDYDLIVHSAAYTNVPKAEEERKLCWELNVTGTKNLLDTPMIYISTDYVFSGEDNRLTGYKEEDPLGPRTYYGFTKAVAEQLVFDLEMNIVIRTSFKPSDWKFPVAYKDQFTSADYVDVIAEKIIWVINNYRLIIDRFEGSTILHIGTERKSVYDLISKRNPEVWPGKKREDAPKDTTLDCSRYERLRLSLGN